MSIRSAKRKVSILASVAALMLILAGPSITPAKGTTPTAVKAVNVAKAAGISQVTPSKDIAVRDYNDDGLPDFFFSRHGSPLGGALYRNDGDRTFSQVEAGTWPHIDRHFCDWADVNGDGLDDLYCTIGADKGTGVKKNELWIQSPAGTFTDQIDAYTGPVPLGGTPFFDPYGRGREPAFLDVNRDGWPDLFVGNECCRQDTYTSPDRLFMNVANPAGGRYFVDGLDSVIEQEVGGMLSVAVDYDNDGWTDLLVCGQSALKLYRNVGGYFSDVTSSVGISGWAADANLVDMNGDARRDLVRDNHKGLWVQLQTTGGTFQPRVGGVATMTASGIGIGDVNADDRPDVYIVQECPAGVPNDNIPDVMLLNDGSGTSFTTMRVPQAKKGCGDDAYPIDYDANGLTDFLVTNGAPAGGDTEGTWCRCGPLQLVAFFPA